MLSPEAFLICIVIGSGFLDVYKCISASVPFLPNTIVPHNFLLSLFKFIQIFHDPIADRTSVNH